MVGPRAPVISDDVLINMDRWNALPADLQGIVSSALFRHAVTGYKELLRQEQQAMQTALDKGVQFIPVSDALMNEFRTTLDGILDAQAAQNANFAKIWTAQRTFRDEYQRFMEKMYPWK